MLDYKEEQASEIEALRSIYSNEEFTGVNFSLINYTNSLCVYLLRD